MANTKVPIELSSTPGIVDNSTATAITIDSAGAATFSGAVTVSNAGVIKASRADNARSLLLYTDNTASTVESDTDPLLLKSADRIQFEANGAERLRIDSNGVLQSNGYSVVASSARPASGTLRLGNIPSTSMLLDYDDQGQTIATVRNQYGSLSPSAELSLDSGFITFNTGTSFTERARLDGNGNLGLGGSTITDYSGTSFLINASAGSAARIKLTTATSGTGITNGGGITYDTSNNLSLLNRELGSIIFYTNNTDVGRIDSSGKLILSNGNIQGSGGVKFSSDTNFAATKAYTFRDGVGIDNPNASSFSTATASIICVGSMSSSRSINATGTINASGADYAEYENNGGLAIAKGDIVVFKADGKLTLTFNEAIRFAVKSTDPSYVGGDTWADEEPPTKNTVEWDEWSASEPEKETTEWGDWSSDEPTRVSIEWNSWYERIEAKRALVDRIAYSGKVPVNIQGATAGDYIIAVAADDGSIDGQAVSDPDFSQYKLSVGRVNRILEDGRAEVAVIIH